MASTPRHARRCTTHRRVLPALLLACIVGLLVLAGPAGAATMPAVSQTVATPRAFVPDWDGHSDATVVQYVLVERSTVLVRITDARGRIVATIDAGRREPGMHLVAWDGRGSNGTVQPPGRYSVRVDARPLPTQPSAGEPGVSAMGGGVVIAGTRAAVITLQSPPVTVRGVELGRATLARSGRRSRTSARFTLSAPASISAAIVDSTGRAVRTLAVRRMVSGSHSLPWDGLDGAGRALGDGEYALMVAASGRGRPTATTRVPLRIDRTMPTLRTSARIRARVATGGIVLPIGVTVSEPSTLVVRVGTRTVRRSLPAGRTNVQLSGSELGIAAGRRTRSIGIRLTIVDGAGNVVMRRIDATVPPTSRVVTRPTQPKPPSTGTTGKLGWPVDGTVTSEFGLRNGRPHQGIDIAAPSGTPIHPVAPGMVTYVGLLDGYGNLVIVAHEGGLRTYYAHMSRFGGFGVGESVDQLDTIGFVGCTGRCSGPHIHFETRIDDVPRDPRSFLSPR